LLQGNPQIDTLHLTMDSTGLSPVIQELISGIGHHRNVQSTTTASLAIVTFDWLLMFDLEVSYIWQDRWGVVKVLYILSRYMPFIDIPITIFSLSVENISTEMCRSLYLCIAVMVYVGIAIADLIFTLRTWAVWGRTKTLGISLAAFYILAWFVAILVPYEIYTRAMVYIPSPVPRLLNCAPQSQSSKLFSISFGGAMVYNIVMLLLMTTRAVPLWRLGVKSNLITMIYRDGIMYYVYTFLISALNFFVLLKYQGDYAALLTMMLRASYSVLSCRVILHIRQQR